MRTLPIALATGMAALAAPPGCALAQPAAPPVVRFVEATRDDDRIAAAALRDIAAGWRDGYAGMIIDLARMMRAPRRAAEAQEDRPASLADEARQDRPAGGIEIVDRGSPVRRRLLDFLGRQTRQRFGDDLDAWRKWLWAQPYEPHPEYAALKSIVYGQIDPRMRGFFPGGVRSSIRLDEIDWGGVTVNGIPPLRLPKTVPAAEARYLKDSHIVFGIVVNGEARAYPKRILGWHEMALDRLGGIDLTIVYCTLCGTVIPYESEAGGRRFRFGTSGLLYRSNKLMFDEDTNSLWSSVDGTPVVGSLVGSGLRLAFRSVVTTTWKEWRTTHPATTVLSLDTGFNRDYAEGAAYRDYFSHDRLMFQVSQADDRLANKAEVLTLRAAGGEGGALLPIAIEARFLRDRPVFSFEVSGQRFVVLTSPAGANRVYRTPVDFPAQAAGGTVRDAAGRDWRATEEALVPADGLSDRLPRVPARRAFWFGWFAQYPDTMLIKR